MADPLAPLAAVGVEAGATLVLVGIVAVNAGSLALARAIRLTALLSRSAAGGGEDRAADLLADGLPGAL